MEKWRIGVLKGYYSGARAFQIGAQVIGRGGDKPLKLKRLMRTSRAGTPVLKHGVNEKVADMCTHLMCFDLVAASL